MATASFGQLERELDRLRLELLPAKFDPIGQYNDEVRTRTRAYLILCHAAFESYFEQEAKRIVRKSQDVFRQSKRIARPTVYLFAQTEREFRNFGREYDPLEQRLEQMIDAVFRDFGDSISENNGIKEVNVRRLLGCLGLSERVFDPMLLSRLNSFGTDRGEHAHKASHFITNVIDPETEFQRVNDLLGDLKTFDAEVARYAALIR